MTVGLTWSHFCSDSLSLVCWLVEHSCTPPLSNTHTQTHIHRYTNTQAYTHCTLECWWSCIGVGFDMVSHRRTRPPKKGAQTDRSFWRTEDGTGHQPRFGRSTTGRAEAESANGKEQIPLGADGVFVAGGPRVAKVSRADRVVA